MQVVTGRQAGELGLRCNHGRLRLVGEGQQQAADGIGFQADRIALDHLHGIPVAPVEHQQPGVGEGQSRSSLQCGRRHLLQPAQHQAQASGIDQLVQVPFQQRRRLVDIACAHQVLDRRRRVFVGEVPAGGGAMQPFGVPGQLTGQGVAQEAAEQTVVAEPLLLRVGWLDEQVGAQQLFDQPGAVAALGEGVAQRRAEAVEDAGLQQEQTDLIALAGEDVFGQVLGQLLVAAGKRTDDIGQGAAAVERQGGQEQTGDPAFADVLQPRYLFVADRQLAAATQVRPGLLRAQTQRFGVNVQHLALHAQAAKTQLGVDPRGDGQAGARRQCGQQLLDEGQGLGGIECFEVVQHHGEARLQSAQLLQERLRSGQRIGD
ncbi:hypothetical protein D3C81_1177630 [compost metagenome]